jgi:hypothetical protein
VGEEGVVAVEPALGLQEGEEEAARGAEQREVRAGGGVVDAGRRVGEGRDRVGEGVVEARAQALAPEDVDPALVGEERVGVGGVRGRGVGVEGAQRLRVGVAHVVRGADQGVDARGAGAGGRPGGGGERAAVGVDEQQQPAPVRGAGGESRGEGAGGVAEREPGRHLREQRAERAGSDGEARARADVVVDAELAAGGPRDGERRGREARGLRERAQGVEGAGVGEQAGRRG